MNDMTLISTGLHSAQGIDLNQFEEIRTEAHTWQTEGGSRVTFVEARGLPMLDLILRFNAGTTQDIRHPGLAALTLHMLSEGSHGIDASQQAERLDGLGAIVNKTIRLEHATLQLRSLSSRALLDQAVEVVAGMVTHPDFPAASLEKIKSQWKAFTRSRLTQPGLRTRIEAYRHLFQGHPYALPLGSTEEGIEAITVDDLRAFHRKGYAASNLEMVMVGDLPRDEAVALGERISQALPQGWTAAQLPEVPDAQSAILHLEENADSTHVMILLPVQALPTEPEYLALELANQIVGVGLESRLFLALRGRYKLTYHISSELKSLSVATALMIQWSVRPEYLQASLNEVKAQLQRFIEEGPTDTELQVARQKLAGKRLRDVSRNDKLAERLMAMSAQRVPDDHLNTLVERMAHLSTEDIRNIVRTRLDLTRLVISTVGRTVEQQPLAETS